MYALAAQSVESASCAGKVPEAAVGVPEAAGEVAGEAAEGVSEAAGEAAREAAEAVETAEAGRRLHPDVVVVDPPRKGCDETLLGTVVKMSPERIVYVSCDSATLARDLKYLTANGYEVRKVQPVDQFGHTVHVETVVLMSRVKE